MSPAQEGWRGRALAPGEPLRQRPLRTQVGEQRGEEEPYPVDVGQAGGLATLCRTPRGRSACSDRR